MKVTLNKKGGVYSVYVPKKDLEELVVEVEQQGAWGGLFTLNNGWILEFPELDEEPELPQTFNTKLVSRG
ncbi:nitrogen fixation protein FixT [Denitrovibrio acetiphilus DSM 12809]|uniref:Nitrogen fixation protein FixT n=1 Tax=Denitrovibrio acetiphilus (strain DSM 12809 / NBRC 114555 / N2460) TaxID=522772 RepID=D4H6V9_DENA2|nr:putative nitrogen fixation protein NifT [Denitrovibrio acetiphilus]ADD67825.1 nitrogen fixation protein FixT [Denitrovibrio acetiphilus DSM 12809]